MTVSAGAGDRAGLRTGDRIVSVNGVPLATPYPFWNAIEQGRPTDTVRLGVQRGGAARTTDVHVRLDPPLELPARVGGTMLTPTHVAALEVLSFYPIPFIVVAGVVLIQRYHDRNAWLLAVMFAGFVVGEGPRVWCAPGPPGGICPIPPHSCRRAEAEAVAAERQQGPAELA